MTVRDISGIMNTDRHVRGSGFESLRVILERDKMGFSLHKTIIPAGKVHHWHYKKHLEACYCIAGRGRLVDLQSHREYIIRPDTVYILDSHDDHWFEALDDVILISVFNPPVKGQEIHQKDGSYA